MEIRPGIHELAAIMFSYNVNKHGCHVWKMGLLGGLNMQFRDCYHAYNIFWGSKKFFEKKEFLNFFFFFKMAADIWPAIYR